MGAFALVAVSLVVAWAGLGVGATLLLDLLALLALRLVLGSPRTAPVASTKAGRATDRRFVLNTMPVSHFAEKARFVLDALGADYSEHTRGGGLTLFLEAKSVPSLVDHASCSEIGNSDHILRFLGDDRLRRRAFSHAQRRSHRGASKPQVPSAAGAQRR